MSVDFNKDFSLTTKPYSVAVTSVREPVNKDKSETNDNSSYSKLHTARDITIGAVGASLVLVTLGVMVRKGVFGKKLQKYLGGAEKEVENSIQNNKNELLGNTPNNPLNSTSGKGLPQNPSESNISQKDNVLEQQSSSNSSTVQQITESKEQPIKVDELQQTYTTTLAQTLKEYKEDDIDIYGIAVGKTFNTRGKTIPSKDMLSKVRNNELTTLYDDKNGITEIILPIGTDFWAVRINGIVSKERAKDIFRTINANGISDPKQFHSIIIDVLNGKLNTKYSLKNIGMYYDFHDNGACKFDGGGGKGCTDGRIMLRKYNPQWKGYSIAYYAPPGHRTTTEIGVALPSTVNERSFSNHYSIFLDGVIPSGTVGRLIRHLETDIIENPKDPKYEELSKIQDAVIKFLNQN